MLGVDPGLVGTGWALLEPTTAAPLVVDTGVIETAANLSLAARIHLIYDAIHAVLDKHAPDLMVLEDPVAGGDEPGIDAERLLGAGAVRQRRWPR